MAKGTSKRIIQKIVIGFVALAVVFVFDFWIFSPKEFSSPDDYEPDVRLENELINYSPLDIEDIAGDIVGDTIQEVENSVEENDIKEEEEISFIPPVPIVKVLKVNLSVPFTSQAPFAEWDDLHNEACEEAVLIIARYWLDDKKLTNDISEQEILDSVDWQEKTFGGHYDLNVSNTVRMGREYFNIQKIYFTSVNSIEDIKYQLSKGNLVITPTAGRLLNNPYYRSPGPAYHMLVVKGYNEKQIITNDPGTKRGADFKYSYDNFFQAIHDWPFSLEEVKFLSKDEKAEEVELQGERMMIVVERE